MRIYCYFSSDAWLHLPALNGTVLPMMLKANPFKTATLLLLFVTLFSPVPKSVRATPTAQSDAITFTIQAGFDGFFQRNSHFIPIKITVSNIGPDIDGTLRVVPSRSQVGPIITRPITLASQSNKELFIYASTVDVLRTVTVEILGPDGQVLVSSDTPTTTLRSQDVLYGIVSDSPSAFGFLTEEEPVGGDVYLAQLTAADLPPLASGWQSLDAVVIADYDSAQLTPAQRIALTDWINAGGHLIVMAGQNSARTTTPLADLLPIISANTASTAVSIGEPNALLEADLPISPVELTSADQVVFSAGNLPLVTQRTVGLGRVSLITADLTLAPMSNWDGLTTWFIRAIPGAHTPVLTIVSERWYTPSSALNALPDALPPSTLLLCVFMGVYIVVLGPINFVILGRLKKRTWAWVTIPVLVLIFSLFSYGLGYSRSGLTPTLHRLGVVEGVAESSRAEMTGMIGLYSPRRNSYTVQLANSALPIPMVGYAGDDNTSLSGQRVEQGDVTRIEGLNVDVSGLETFAYKAHVDIPVITAQLQQTQSAGVVQIEGNITLPAGVSLTRPALLVRGDAEPLSGELSGTTQISVDTTSLGGQATPFGNSLVSGNVPYAQVNNAVDAILGTTFGFDADLYREDQVLEWYLEENWARLQGGVYLFGWQSETPLDVSLATSSYDTNDLTLYVYQLAPDLVVNENEASLTLTPELMSYEIIDQTLFGDFVNIYDNGFYNTGYFTVRYRPRTPIEFSSVDSLKLRLDWNLPYQTQDVEVELYNVQNDTWDRISITGSIVSIANPADYVREDGSLDLQFNILQNDTYVEVYSLDFTAVLVP